MKFASLWVFIGVIFVLAISSISPATVLGSKSIPANLLTELKGGLDYTDCVQQDTGCGGRTNACTNDDQCLQGSGICTDTHMNYACCIPEGFSGTSPNCTYLSWPNDYRDCSGGGMFNGLCYDTLGACFVEVGSTDTCVGSTRQCKN